MINWGIIGAGRIAHRFATALKYDSRAQLYALSCRSVAKAKAFQAEFPCFKAYDSFQAVIDDEAVDAIYIALPHYYHYEWVIKALKAKKAVLVEKPATINVAQMEAIKQVALENKTLFMEAMKTRFVPGYIAAKKLINDNVIGKIQRIETCFCGSAAYDANSYLFDPKQGGGLLDVGIYNISYLDDFLKGSLDDVLVECEYHPCEVDNYVNATLTFGNQVGVVECAIDRKKENQVTFIGETGKIVMKQLHRPIDIEIIKETTGIKHVEYDHDDFYSEIAHFNDLLENKQTESPLMSLDDSIRCAKILAAIKEKM